MPQPYEPIPPEREAMYLQNAQEAMNEAAEPVLKELGSLAIRDAEQLTAIDAASTTIGQETGSYVQENDLSKKFIEDMEQPRESGIAEQTEKYLGAGFAESLYTVDELIHNAADEQPKYSTFKKEYKPQANPQLPPEEPPKPNI